MAGDRRTRRATIGVEPMEARVVLSTASPTRRALVHGPTYLDLQGSAAGSSVRVVGDPDVGSAVAVQGSGPFSGLGTMRVSGDFHGTGLFANSNLDATLKLSSVKGSITLELQGPRAPGFTAPTSGAYQFTTSKGTGSLAHDLGNGTVDVVLGPGTFRLTFQGKPSTY